MLHRAPGHMGMQSHRFRDSCRKIGDRCDGEKDLSRHCKSRERHLKILEIRTAATCHV